MTITDRYRDRYRTTYPDFMAMNLRLPEELATALRDLAQQTGRSQQDLAREALEEYVHDYPLRAYPKEVRHLITPATRPFGEIDPELHAVLHGIGHERLAAAAEWDRQDRH